MNDIQLPEGYRFNEEYLASYQTGDDIAELFDWPWDEEPRIVDPEHPLAEFLEWHIRFVINSSDYIRHNFKGAWEEIRYQNMLAGIPRVFPLSTSEMEEKGYLGSIERLQQYIGELEKAIDCANSKGVPEDMWPIFSLIRRKEEFETELQKILDLEGVPDFELVEIKPF